MGLGSLPPLRSLPRAFVSGAEPGEPFELPQEDIDKFRRVLRLQAGAKVAILPNDGTILVCEFLGRMVRPIEVENPESEPRLQLTLAQALPKGDKLDEIVRACTEAGVSRFILFPSERTVVRWDEDKTAHRVRRLETIAREAAEVCFRTRLPVIEVLGSLAEVIDSAPDCVVLSEVEGLPKPLQRVSDAEMTVTIGPEGGWSPKELAIIGNRGVTLGPRVLRVDHAGLAAASILLLAHAE